MEHIRWLEQPRIAARRQAYSAGTPVDEPPTILFVGNVVRHKGAHHSWPQPTRSRVHQALPSAIVGSAGLRPAHGLSPYEVELRSGRSAR